MRSSVVVRIEVCLALICFSACVNDRAVEDEVLVRKDRCSHLVKQVAWADPIGTLDHISELFEIGCYQETIDLGERARSAYSHKEFSLIKESVELFIPEGTVTDYVLESYERGYLSFILTLSYIKLNRFDSVSVELNRFYHEEVAATYNQGQDAVNALLQAALWDNFPRDGYSSRPFWLWLSKSDQIEGELQAFASNRIKNMDDGKASPKWSIEGIGHFPELTWSLDFVDASHGYFGVEPKTRFPTSCSDQHTMVMPTNSWLHKIGIRHSHSYHPLVNAKTWIRLPVGLVYGISTAVSGAGIVIGGCSAAMGLRDSGPLCGLSIEGGFALMAKSGDVVRATLRPDLRHWRRLPEAILLHDAAESGDSPCARSVALKEVMPLL